MYLVWSLDKDLKGRKQLVYAVNHDNFEIIISNSGHGKIVKGKDKRDYEGGWIFLNRKITYYSGTLGEVTVRREEVKESILNFLIQI